jgi:hypothetical protein
MNISVAREVRQSLRPGPLCGLVGLLLGAVTWTGCDEATDGQTETSDLEVTRVEDCGLPGSQGNELGVGQFCERDAECTSVASPLQLHCSTVLVDSALPLLCSASCEQGVTDCGSNASCRNLLPIGYDLIVCVPDACEQNFLAIFTEPDETSSSEGGG